MDGNKDESEHCISIAQKYINEGDRSKALKFLYKAEKLYPSQRAKGELLLHHIRLLSEHCFGSLETHIFLCLKLRFFLDV